MACGVKSAALQSVKESGIYQRMAAAAVSCAVREQGGADSRCAAG